MADLRYWLFCLLTLLAACSNDPGSGPLDTKWDRAVCERCRMVLSDRMHAAQVRLPASNGRSHVYFFDDLGCALIWLESRSQAEPAESEIWVNDWRDGRWIDARNAHYLSGQHTPMAYGFGAQDQPAPEAVGFEQARAAILEQESGHHQSQAHQHRPSGG